MRVNETKTAKGTPVAHIIVFGNEKGGSGKSTTAMHVATALAHLGHRVGGLDLDLRQRSFGRYLENRQGTIAARDMDVPSPFLIDLPEIDPERSAPTRISMTGGCLRRWPISTRVAISSSSTAPARTRRLSQVAHSLADTLITPMNDSFVDFDLLARIDPETYEIKGPSVYSEMVWHSRQLRAKAGLKPIDWVVLRNRLGAQQMHNKRKMGEALTNLSRRIGFRVAPGMSERVIFRELFPTGMTLAGPARHGGGAAQYLQPLGPAGIARPDEDAEPAGRRGGFLGRSDVANGPGPRRARPLTGLSSRGEGDGGGTQRGIKAAGPPRIVGPPIRPGYLAGLSAKLGIRRILQG